MDELIKRIKAFNAARSWKKFHTPRNLATSLSLETAEVLEVFQWKLDDKVTQEEKEELKDELADVFVYLLQLSAALDIDLIDAANKKIDKNEAKYPVEKAKGSSTKYTKFK